MNILLQADSLTAVLEHQCGSGRPSLLEAGSRIRSAQRVLITGMGASLYASIPLEYHLSSRGIEAVSLEAAELLHYRHPAYRDSVVVVISRSGESIEIAKLLTVLKGRNTIIGITNEPHSRLAKTANLALQLRSLADESVAIQSYTGTLLMLYLLGGAITDELDDCLDAVTALLPEFSRFATRCLDAMEEWDSFLCSRSPIYLLGRGPSYGSALEGALLFNEIARAPAVGLPVASFRHGPAEIVDDTFRGIIFAPRGPARELNLGLARDLIGFGGAISVIGPEPQLPDSRSSCSVPAVPDSIAPLFEIVPVQAAALRLAQMRSIVPGRFRYTPQVATDEASLVSFSHGEESAGE